MRMFLNVSLLSPVHLPEDDTAMDLGSRKCDMEERSDDLERNLPSIPQTAK